MSEFHDDPILDPQGSTPPHRPGFWARIRAYFLAGVLIISPIVITLALAFWLINFVDSHIVPLVPEQWNPDTYLREHFGIKFSVPGIGVLILFVVITLVGWLTASYLGRIFVRIGENIVARMPIVRGIYGAVKQIMETIFRNQSQAFRRAVLVEYPRRDLWTIAFVTGKTEGEVKTQLKDDLVNIYVPTTPNPTSGYLEVVPLDQLVSTDWTLDEAMNFIISGGAIAPENIPYSRVDDPATAPAEPPGN